jgi:hypothetical protein
VGGDLPRYRRYPVSTREDLLLTLVEADASHRPNREQFFMTETFGGVTITHPALPGGEVKCNKPDILDLIDLDYLRPTYGSNVLFLDVTDAGFDEASRARLSGAMHRTESPPITVMVVGEDSYAETPPDIEAERGRLAKIATDFGWHIGFAQEPDGSWFWLVLDVETDEPLKSGTAPTWQDALIDCVKDLVPPNTEG